VCLFGRRYASSVTLPWLEEDRGFETPCWIWSGTKSRKGYGLTSTNASRGDGRGRLAHRRLWEGVYGKLADDFQLHHRCEQPACVRPDHLEPVTATGHAQRHALARVGRRRHRETIIEMWAAGATAREIAQVLDTTVGTVQTEVHRLRRRGVEMKRRHG
jgi:DNA-binding CsgD family transcriptional regulator